MDEQAVTEMTVSQFMMKAMEDFSRSEPKMLFMVWGSEDDSICFRHIEVTYPEMIGICEYIKARALRRMQGE